MNKANAVTIARIALVPVFVWLVYEGSTAGAIAAFVVFLVASASDSLDGHLARKYNLITRMGQFLDPTADKLLVGSALYVLVDTREFPLWAALVIAIRELAVQILRTEITRGGRDLPASGGGKLKTVLQITMVSWWLLPWPDQNPVHWVLMVAAVAVTITSGLRYFRRAERTAEASS